MEKDEEGGSSPAHKSWGTSLGDGQLDGDRWFHILFKLFFPAGVYLAFLATVMLVYGSDKGGDWVDLTVLFLIPPAGTGVIVPLGMNQGFSGTTMALTVAMVDGVISMYVCWWLVILKRVPLIGRIFVWLEGKGSEKIESSERLKTGSWWAIYAVLLVPVQGSGGMNMSVVGRLIGMRADHVISAVVCGSLTIAFIVAFIAKVGTRMFEQGIGTLIIFLLIMVQVACVAYLVQLRYKMSRERTRSSREA